MFVKSIFLQYFRNYEKMELQLSPEVNILKGDNAQGKTNLLEALSFCATGRSHKGANEKECIRYGEEEAIIRLVYERYREEKIEMSFRKDGSKTILVNGAQVGRIADLFGNFHVVVFSPEDLSLVKDGPANRRRFMDMELCQVDPVYLHNLQHYYHVRKQRDQLLKDAYNNPTLCDVMPDWDRQLAIYGVRVCNRRRDFIASIQPFAEQLHSGLSKGREQLKLSYEGPELDEDGFAERLERDLAKDLRSGYTNFGPHRDDIDIEINGEDVRTYGSQGQQRTAALSMKLSEFELMKKELGFAPVLLLDDVMSELDGSRQAKLLEYIRENQTLITGTGIEDSLRGLPAGKIFEVKAGTVSEGEL